MKQNFGSSMRRRVSFPADLVYGLHSCTNVLFVSRCGSGRHARALVDDAGRGGRYQKVLLFTYPSAACVMTISDSIDLLIPDRLEETGSTP